MKPFFNNNEDEFMPVTLATVKTDPLAHAWELRSLAGIVLNSFRPLASEKDSILSNDIPDDIIINVDREKLAGVLGCLLSEIISQTSGSYIRLAAKVYTDVILLHIKDYNTESSIVIDKSLQSLAISMGGFVGVTSIRDALTTVAFSFTNLPLAA